MIDFQEKSIALKDKELDLRFRQMESNDKIGSVSIEANAKDRKDARRIGLYRLVAGLVLASLVVAGTIWAYVYLSITNHAEEAKQMMEKIIPFLTHVSALVGGIYLGRKTKGKNDKEEEDTSS